MGGGAGPGRLGGLASAQKLSAEARIERATRGGNATARMYGLEHYARVAAASGMKAKLRQMAAFDGSAVACAER